MKRYASNAQCSCLRDISACCRAQSPLCPGTTAPKAKREKKMCAGAVGKAEMKVIFGNVSIVCFSDTCLLGLARFATMTGHSANRSVSCPAVTCYIRTSKLSGRAEGTSGHPHRCRCSHSNPQSLSSSLSPRPTSRTTQSALRCPSTS